MPLAGQHKRQKKAGRRCERALSVSRVICGTKVYQCPRQSLLPIVSEPPRQLPAQAVHRFSLHLLCPALAKMEMECCADQRMLNGRDHRPFATAGRSVRRPRGRQNHSVETGPRETILRGRFCFSRTGCAVRLAGREKYGCGNVLVSLFNIKLLKNNKKLLQNDIPCAILLPIQTERGSRI